MGLTARDLLVAGDVESYAALMHEHWMHKRERSAEIANPESTPCTKPPG